MLGTTLLCNLRENIFEFHINGCNKLAILGKVLEHKYLLVFGS